VVVDLVIRALDLKLAFFAKDFNWAMLPRQTLDSPMKGPVELYCQMSHVSQPLGIVGASVAGQPAIGLGDTNKGCPPC